MRPTSIIISVSFRWGQDKTFCLLKLAVVVEQSDSRLTLGQPWLGVFVDSILCENGFGWISLNDNPASGPVGWPSSLSFRGGRRCSRHKSSCWFNQIPSSGLFKSPAQNRKEISDLWIKSPPNPLKTFWGWQCRWWAAQPDNFLMVVY